jgi:hypothetical protein
MEKKRSCILSLPPGFVGEMLGFILLTIFFSNGFKFTIGFVGLHVSPTYSIVDLKRLCMEIVDKWLGE